MNQDRLSFVTFGCAIAAGLITLAVACDNEPDNEFDLGAFAGSVLGKVYKCTVTCQGERGGSNLEGDDCQKANPPDSSFDVYACAVQSGSLIAKNDSAVMKRAIERCKAAGFPADRIPTVACSRPTQPATGNGRRGGRREPVHRVENVTLPCANLNQLVDVVHECRFVFNTEEGSDPLQPGTNPPDEYPNLADSISGFNIDDPDSYPILAGGSDSLDAEEAVQDFLEENDIEFVDQSVTDGEVTWHETPFTPEDEHKCGPAVDCEPKIPLSIAPASNGGPKEPDTEERSYYDRSSERQ